MGETVVGTSFYVGIPQSTTCSARDSIAMAADVGIRYFFTSLQMPEADIPGSLPELREIGHLVEDRKLHVMADVHPIVFRRVGGSIRDLGPIRELGIQALRLDAGFAVEEIHTLCETAEQLGMSIVLNASPIRPEDLDYYERLGISLEGRVASHNYYPRFGTGLSEAYLDREAALLHARGVVIMGFVASQSCHRFMTYEGLPTLERHRTSPVGRAARETLARGWLDQVYIGDQTDDLEELRDLARVAEDPHVVLRVRIDPMAREPEKSIAFGRVHTQLAQEFALVYRARGDRQRDTIPLIQPQASPASRPRGTVTIDNVFYPRFAGELQIAREDLPPDVRTNIVGRVVDEDMELLTALGPRARFALVDVDAGPGPVSGASAERGSQA